MTVGVMTLRRIWLILALVALALRLPDIGNPLVDLDEQMYLLVGQRIWHGALPYVDIWDRKPIGLFLIYAFAARLPGDPVVAYHLLALVAAVSTAGVIAIFVRRFDGGRGALAAGILHLVWLELIGGRGGQSPVFYDLPMAMAALLAWDALSGRRSRAPPAMVLVGLALQVKPTAVFEGCFLGLVLLVASWRGHRTIARVAADAALYIAVALVPTLATAGFYAAIGHGDAWWFANVRSIFLRRVAPDEPIVARLTGLAVVLAVPLLIALRGILGRKSKERLFLTGWLAAAVTGWLLVPPYMNHYALPLLVPIAVAAGRALDRTPMQWLAGLAGIGLLGLSGYPHAGATVDTRRRLAVLAATVRRHAGAQCPFVFQAPPALYSAAGACLPSRYPFWPHLVDPAETLAIGVDPLAEVDRILAATPPVIVTGHPRASSGRATVVHVDRAIAQFYRPVARDLGVVVYVRRNPS